MNRHLAPIFLALLVMLAVGSCRGDKITPGVTEAKRPLVTGVSIAGVASISQPGRYEAVGTVTAQTESEIAAKLLSVVERVLVREGDRVKKGDLLVVLDKRQIQAGVRAAEEVLAQSVKLQAAAAASRDTARATLELSRLTRDRYAALAAKQAVSNQDYDRVLAEYKQAESQESRAAAEVAAAAARVEQAKAGLDSARLSLADTEIVAPSLGVIKARLVEPGDMAAPNRPLLTLEDAASRRLEVQLPETYLGRVRIGMELSVLLPALSGEPFIGRVAQVFPAADPASHSFLVKIALPATLVAHTGMFGRVIIPLAAEDRILVPASALVRHGQLEGVYLVDADNIARFRLIRTGRALPDGVQVLSGLAAGDRYVVAPPPDLNNGSRIGAGS